MNSKYGQDRAASAEILRLILQKMAGHPAALNPSTYAVWYESLAGINPPLNDAMNSLLTDNGVLTTEIAQQLFDRYVSDGNPDAQNAFRLNIEKLLGDLSLLAESTGSETNRFSESMKKHGETLDRGLDVSALKHLVGDIIQDTQVMRSSVESLQGKLHESKEEVENLQKALMNARTEALIDPLTGVLNRRGFDAQMNKLISSPELKDKRVCFLMLDIDLFKKINDTYGHSFGDKVIRGIASALTTLVKGQDSVARMGGEEFAVILPDTHVKGAYALAEQIRLRIAGSKIRRAEKQASVEGITVSIGIADCDVNGDWHDALGKADEALYASKAQGRNRTTVYAAKS